jgi:hypothetical protein
MAAFPRQRALIRITIAPPARSEEQLLSVEMHRSSGHSPEFPGVHFRQTSVKKKE